MKKFMCIMMTIVLLCGVVSSAFAGTNGFTTYNAGNDTPVQNFYYSYMILSDNTLIQMPEQYEVKQEDGSKKLVTIVTMDDAVTFARRYAKSRNKEVVLVGGTFTSFRFSKEASKDGKGIAQPVGLGETKVNGTVKLGVLKSHIVFDSGVPGEYMISKGGKWYRVSAKSSSTAGSTLDAALADPSSAAAKQVSVVDPSERRFAMTQEEKNIASYGQLNGDGESYTFAYRTAEGKILLIYAKSYTEAKKMAPKGVSFLEADSGWSASVAQEKKPKDTDKTGLTEYYGRQVGSMDSYEFAYYAPHQASDGSHWEIGYIFTAPSYEEAIRLHPDLVPAYVWEDNVHMHMDASAPASDTVGQKLKDSYQKDGYSVKTDNVFVLEKEPVFNPTTGMYTFYFVSTTTGEKCTETMSIDKMAGITRGNRFTDSAAEILAGYARRLAAYHNTTDQMAAKVDAKTIIADYKAGDVPDEVLHNPTFSSYVKSLLLKDGSLTNKQRSSLIDILYDAEQSDIVNIDGEHYAVRGKNNLVTFADLSSVVQEKLDLETIKSADKALLDIIWTSGLFETLDEEKKQAFKDNLFAKYPNLTKVVFSDGTSLMKPGSAYKNMSQSEFYSMLCAMNLSTLESLKDNGTYEGLNSVFQSMLDARIAQVKARTAEASQLNFISGLASAIGKVATKGAKVVIDLFTDPVGTISVALDSAKSFLKKAADKAVATAKAVKQSVTATATVAKSYTLSLGGSKYTVTGKGFDEAVAKVKASVKDVLTKRVMAEDEDFHSQSRAYNKALDEEKAKADAKIAAASSTAGKKSSSSSSVAGAIVAGITSTVNIITTTVKTLTAVVSAVTSVVSAIRGGGLGSQAMTTK